LIWGKEHIVQLSPRPSTSWEDQAEEVEALGKENIEPSDQDKLEKAKIARTPTNAKKVWMVAGKKKKSPSITQPMVTRS
jgi:hypothetical protein